MKKTDLETIRKAILTSEEILKIDSFARMHTSFSEEEVYKMLRENNIFLSTKENYNLPRKKFVRAGFFKIRKKYLTIDEQLLIIKSAYITSKGENYLLQTLFV